VSGLTTHGELNPYAPPREATWAQWLTVFRLTKFRLTVADRVIYEEGKW
jgi:hypothetical protein